MVISAIINPKKISASGSTAGVAHRVQFSLSDIRYFVPPSQARGDIIAVRYIWGEVATVLCFLSVRRALLAIKGENIYPDCHKNSILTVRGGLVPNQL